MYNPLLTEAGADATAKQTHFAEVRSIIHLGTSIHTNNASHKPTKEPHIPHMTVTGTYPHTFAHDISATTVYSEKVEVPMKW